MVPVQVLLKNARIENPLVVLIGNPMSSVILSSTRIVNENNASAVFFLLQWELVNGVLVDLQANQGL